MASLLRFAARKVCGHAGPLEASFAVARSLALVKEEQQRKLPWTIFHGRMSSLRWFSSSPESPYDPLAKNQKHFPVSLGGTRGLEEKRQELLRLLSEMDDLQAERCAMEIKKNTKLLQLLGRPPSKPWSAEDFKRLFGANDLSDFILSLPFLTGALLCSVFFFMLTISLLFLPFTSTTGTVKKYKEHKLSEIDLPSTKDYSKTYSLENSFIYQVE